MARLARRLAFCSAALLAALGAAAPERVQAQRLDPDLEVKLTPEQATAYREHLRARATHEGHLDSYWDDVELKRDARKRKRAAQQPYAATDYVRQQPPKYSGPPIPADVAKVIAGLALPEPTGEPRAGVEDFLANAKSQYGFVPERTTEAEFKRRYAEESLAAGLTKMQVVRVYALETGGRGTYDMQAGIDPDTRQGKPISSALGYAQLLNANSIDVLVRYGGEFIERLNAMAARASGDQKRVAALRAKIAALGRMQRAARSVPNEWSHHVRFSNTPRGLGIHALNIDADIGPWLQVMKLKDVPRDGGPRRAHRSQRRGARADEPCRPPHGPRDDGAARPRHADLQLLQPHRLLSQHHRARAHSRRAAGGARGAHGGASDQARLPRVHHRFRRGDARAAGGAVTAVP